MFKPTTEVLTVTTLEAIRDNGNYIVSDASRELYVSIWRDDMAALYEAFARAHERGVKIFGMFYGDEVPMGIGSWTLHSYQQIVADRLGGRMLTIVADGEEALISHIPHGGQASGRDRIPERLAGLEGNHRIELSRKVVDRAGRALRSKPVDEVAVHRHLIRQVERKHRDGNAAREHRSDRERILERVPLCIRICAGCESRVDVSVRSAIRIGRRRRECTSHPDDLGDSLADLGLALQGADEGREGAQCEHRELRPGGGTCSDGADEDVLGVGARVGRRRRRAAVQNGKKVGDHRVGAVFPRKCVDGAGITHADWAESRNSDGDLQAAAVAWLVSCEYRCCGVW